MLSISGISLRSLHPLIKTIEEGVEFMVIDNMKFCNQFRGLGKRFEMAFDFITRLAASKRGYTTGRYEIDGDNVYAIVSEYTTSDPGNKDFEAHRKYIDIQCILEGHECIYYSPSELLEEKTTYSYEKDFELFSGKGIGIPMGSGDFAIFYPQDAHKPGCYAENPEDVVKVIVKIVID